MLIRFNEKGVHIRRNIEKKLHDHIQQNKSIFTGFEAVLAWPPLSGGKTAETSEPPRWRGENE